MRTTATAPARPGPFRGGRLAPGARADLVVLDDAPPVRRVMVRGGRQDRSIAATGSGRPDVTAAESPDPVPGRAGPPGLPGEELARQWCRWHAAPRTLGGRPGAVHSAGLAYASHRGGHELDVVVSQQRPGGADTVLAVGEAKCTNRPVGLSGLDRLAHLRDLVPADRVDAPPRLLLFSRGGFTADLRRAASARADVELVDLERLYRGH